VLQLTNPKVDGEISTWLNAPDPTTNHNRLSKIRESKQIASWFLESQLRQWQGSEKRVCWIHGKRKDHYLTTGSCWAGLTHSRSRRGEECFLVRNISGDQRLVYNEMDLVARQLSMFSSQGIPSLASSTSIFVRRANKTHAMLLLLSFSSLASARGMFTNASLNSTRHMPISTGQPVRRHCSNV